MRESHDEDLFAEAYVVAAEFMSDVIKFIDECWLNKTLDEIEFYKLEDKFGGYKANRIKLIHTIEYARIAGRFDDTVYFAIEQNAPAEANSLDSSFSPTDVYFG